MKWLKKILGVDTLEKELLELSSDLSKLKKSQKDNDWKLNRDLSGKLESFEDTFGWRKVTKHLKGWKKPAEFVELYAHVYVLDKGYRKVLPPFLKSDSKGNQELDKKDWLKNDWDGEYELRCYMVTRLIVPGYFKMEDFLTNDSNNFTFEKMFGKDRKNLVSHMEQFNFHNKDEDMYSLNFYEL